jgi:hypothetical protein
MRNKVVGAICFLASIGAPSTVWSQVSDEALFAELGDIYSGRIDNHRNLPTERPLMFALSLDFAVALKSVCPANFPNDYETSIGQSIQAYIWRLFGEPKITAVPGEGFFSGALRYLADPAVANLPWVFKRNALMNRDLNSLARIVIKQVGGCESKEAKRLSTNLAAIGLFGTLQSNTIRKTLTRREETDNRVGFVCFYDDNPSDSREFYQGYTSLTALNFWTRSGPLKMFLDNMERQYNQRYTGINDATRPKMPPFRVDCPLTIDPGVSLQSQYVLMSEKPANPNAPLSQRMADYYIDVMVPDDRAREKEKTGKEYPEPPAGFIALLREEIRKIEDCPGNEIHQKFPCY